MLVPVYFGCPNVCNFLLEAMARVLPRVALEPGREFQVVTVSFDETDTPAVAARRKSDFVSALAGGFPAEHWHFLTGDLPNINRLMDAIGFHFKREGDIFQHPVTLVVVSPSGKIVRYLHGGNPLPFDITMAATEAAAERVGLSVKRAVALCYSYDPESRRYVFDFMKVAGFSIIAALGLFLVFLILGGRRRRR